EPQERAALERNVVANRAAQHRVPGLERVEDGRARDRAADVELHLVANVRQSAQVRREDDAHHRRFGTSTDSTAGRSRTMGVQLSPASADMYTCPPEVPKYTPHLSSESTAIASRSTFTYQSLCGRTYVIPSHSWPPLRLRYTRSLPSSGKCSESLLIGTT